MKAIFYKAKYGNAVDKMIAWWTAPLANKVNGEWKNGYSHVELLFSDGMMFSASQYENAVRMKRHKESDAWEYVELSDVLPSDAICEDVVRNEAEKLIGAEYDYMGVLGFLLGTADSEGRWFCSEVCAEMLYRCGMEMEMDSGEISPNKLYTMLHTAGTLEALAESTDSTKSTCEGK